MMVVVLKLADQQLAKCSVYIDPLKSLDSGVPLSTGVPADTSRPILPRLGARTPRLGSMPVLPGFGASLGLLAHVLH